MDLVLQSQQKTSIESVPDYNLINKKMPKGNTGNSSSNSGGSGLGSAGFTSSGVSKGSSAASYQGSVSAERHYNFHFLLESSTILAWENFSLHSFHSLLFYYSPSLTLQIEQIRSGR